MLLSVHPFSYILFIIHLIFLMKHLCIFAYIFSWITNFIQTNKLFLLSQVVFQMPTSRLKSKSLQPQPWSAATMTSSIRYVASLTFFSCVFWKKERRLLWHKNKACLKTLSQSCFPKCSNSLSPELDFLYCSEAPCFGGCYFGLIYIV